MQGTKKFAVLPALQAAEESLCWRVHFSQRQGRHAVAVRSIEPGGLCRPGLALVVALTRLVGDQRPAASRPLRKVYVIRLGLQSTSSTAAHMYWL